MESCDLSCDGEITLSHHEVTACCLLAVLEGRENDPPMHEIHDNEGFEDDEGIAESGM